MKKKLFNVIMVLLILMLVFSTFIIMNRKINNKLLFVGDRAVIWVVTGSMQDVIPEKSYILVKKVSVTDDLKEGDIITFYSTDPEIFGRLNTHQIVFVDKENGCYVTKGTNNPHADSYTVPFENVVAVYQKNLTLLTAFGRFFTTPKGFVIVTFILILIACFIYVPDIITAFRGDQKNLREQEIQRRIDEEVEKLKNSKNNID